jgi:hypothetical protein
MENASKNPLAGSRVFADVTAAIHPSLALPALPVAPCQRTVCKRPKSGHCSSGEKSVARLAFGTGGVKRLCAAVPHLGTYCSVSFRMPPVDPVTLQFCPPVLFAKQRKLRSICRVVVALR